MMKTRENTNTIWSCLVAVTPCVLSGFTIGFSSTALPRLDLSLNELSWFGSLHLLVAPIGSVLIGSIIDRYGRKCSLVVSVLPGLVGWTLISGMLGAKRLFFGRILTGISVGASAFPGQVYAAECVDTDASLTNFRSSLVNWSTMATSFGYLAALLLGSVITYECTAFIAFILALCSVFLIVLFVPESPVWLYRDAIATKECSRSYISVLYANFAETTQCGEESALQYLKKIKRQDVYIPLFVMSTLQLLIALSGTEILTVYMVYLMNFDASTVIDEHSYNLSVVAAILMLAGAICEVSLASFTGVRKLAIFSGVCMTLCMLAYGVCELNNNHEYEFVRRIVCLAAIWAASFTYTLGFVSIPRAALGEVFPVDAKGFATVPSVIAFVASCVVVKLHPYFASYAGGYAYVFYGTMCALETTFAYFFLSETVGKSLARIQQEFANV